MKEINLKKDEIVEYKDIQYKVLQNRIVKHDKKKKTMTAINIISILTVIVLYILYYFMSEIFGIYKGILFIDSISFYAQAAIVVLGFIIFIVAHEYVHYLTYRIAGKTQKNSIKFGVALKSGMAYCVSLVPNTIKASRLSLMMPFYVLVIPFFIVAVLLKSGLLAFLAVLFASGSAGDFWYMWTLRNDKADKHIIEAIPEGSEYEIGYLLLEKIND